MARPVRWSASILVWRRVLSRRRKEGTPSEPTGGTASSLQRCILVAFDCLDKGAEAAPVLATQLQAAGFTARAIDLGLGKGGDVADFCRLHDIAAVTALAKLPDIQPSLAAPTRR